MQELNNHFSTLRNAKVSAFKWATGKEIPYHYLNRLQGYCANSMEMLDYKKIEDEKEYEMYSVFEKIGVRRWNLVIFSVKEVFFLVEKSFFLNHLLGQKITKLS